MASRMDTSTTDDDSYLLDAGAVEELGRYVEEAWLYLLLSGKYSLTIRYKVECVLPFATPTPL